MSVRVVSPKTRKHLPVGKKPKLAIAKKERFTKWQKHKKNSHPKFSLESKQNCQFLLVACKMVGCRDDVKKTLLMHGMNG
jgi:hypothetical protein